MKKQRVYELAKQVGLSNQAVIEKLATLGIKVKTHFSTLGEEEVKKFLTNLEVKATEQELPAQLPAKPFKGIQAERWLKVGIFFLGIAIVISLGVFIYKYFAVQSAPPRTYFDFQLRIWQQVVEKDPKNALGHANLGFVYLQMKKYDQAIDAFKTALKYDPKNVTALYNLGITNYELGKKKLAIENLKAAAEAAPAGNKFLAYYKLGEIYQEQKKYPQAIEVYQKSIQDDPTMWNSHFKLGQLYEKTKQKDLALEEFKKASVFNPNSTEIKKAIERLSK